MSKLYMIRKEGGSRVMTVSKIVPKEWLAVTATIVRKSNRSVTVKFEKVQ